MATKEWKENNHEHILEYRRNWYKQNKKAEVNRVLLRKEELRIWFRNYKSNLSCAVCNESHPACIDFHHKQPSKKDKEVSKLVSSGASKKRILNEISKCQVLCANCHRKLHYDKITPL